MDHLMSALQAAQTLVEVSNGRHSNLVIQKLLYIAQMISLGETGQPLFEEDFVSRNLGPILPSVYAKAKMYGARTVTNLFVRSLPNGPQRDLLIRVHADLLNCSSARLVSMTHHDGGGWAQNFNCGSGIISKQHMLDEYHVMKARIERLKELACA